MQQPAPDPAIQQLQSSSLGSDYDVLEMLGAGGFGTVFKARHRVLSRLVAIKIVKLRDTDDAGFKRFLREAQLLSEISNPHVARVYSYGQLADGVAYMVMEYVNAVPLNNLIPAAGPDLKAGTPPSALLDVKRFRSIFLQSAQALAALSKLDIVHRDIKPANILVVSAGTDREQIKLVDFGLSKRISTEPATGQELTKAGDTLGTPIYMSPEVCRGQKFDATSDIYSLGCVMYELMTGSPPFQSASPYEVMMMHVTEPPQKPTARNPHLAQWECINGLEDVVLRCLNKSPEARYSSAQELMMELRSVTQVQPTSSSAKLARGWLRPAHLIIAGTLITGALVAGFLFRNQPKQKPPAPAGRSSRTVFAEEQECTHAWHSDPQTNRTAVLQHITELGQEAVAADDVDHLLSGMQRMLMADAIAFSQNLLEPKLKGAAKLRAAQTMRAAAIESLTLASQNQLPPPVPSLYALLDSCYSIEPRRAVADDVKRKLIMCRERGFKDNYNDCASYLARVYLFLGDPATAKAVIDGLDGGNNAEHRRLRFDLTVGLLALYGNQPQELLDRWKVLEGTATHSNVEDMLANKIRAKLSLGQLEETDAILKQRADSKGKTPVDDQLQLLIQARKKNWKQAATTLEAAIQGAKNQGLNYFILMTDWDLRTFADWAQQDHQPKLAEAALKAADAQAAACRSAMH